MKINDGRITILASEKEVTIELRDSEASIIFAKITMTAEQFTHALSRVANKKVESMEVFNLDKVGKKMVYRILKVNLGKKYRRYEDLIKHATKKAMEQTPKGWENDLYFNHQNCFIKENDCYYAMTTIRKWE